MRQPSCHLEEQLAAAVRTGHWPDGLQAHAADCEACAETMLVAGSLLELASEPVPAPPEPGLVWWRTQLRLRRQAQEQLERPIQWVDRLVPVAGLCAALWGATWLSESSAAWAYAAIAGIVVLLAVAGSLYWFAARQR